MKKETKFNYQPSSISKYLIVGMLMFFIPFFAQAQSKTINGVVTDENKMALPGVTITIKGTKTATSSDFDGHFKIQASSTDQLIFSYIGFDTKTVAVGEKTTINAAMQPTNNSLDEVVVVGYGTVKKGDLTGSVTKAPIADIQKAPVRSFDEALAGRVAGVQVTSGDGQPGGGINIVIRGNNSVTQSNSPLYVIDGFPIENMDNNTINPQDIESLDILKDASATAIYGARAANGVVVITTKKGKTGPAVFSFDSSTGIQDNIARMDVMSPYEFVKLQLEIDSAPVSTTPFKSATQLYLPPPIKLDDYKNVQGIDWQDKVLRSAVMQNFNLSVRGGTKKTKYALSGNILDQDGIIIASNYKRYQGRLVLDHNITKNLKVGINTNYSYLKQSGSSPSQSNFSATVNTMYGVWGYRPVNGGMSTTDDGDLYDDEINRANDYRVNPVTQLQNELKENITQNLTSNAYLDYEFIPGLKLRVTGGIIENRNEKRAFNNSKTSGGAPGSNNGVNGRIDNSDYSNWLNENTLTWDKTFNKHSLNVLGGFTIQEQKSKIYGQAANHLPNEDLGLDGLDQGTPIRIDTHESVWTMASFLSRVNYNYDQRYFLTASMRADGSSKFPSDNHWGYFPSAAVSWKFKNEKFLKNNNVLSEGKLRFSYGETGNNRVGDFDYLTQFFNPIDRGYSFNNAYIGGVLATNLGNSQLKWETTAATNLGIDLGFFKQRVTLTAEVYRKRTNDLLLKADLPTSSGFSTASKNVGAMENKGLEFTLNTVNVKTSSFNWSTSFNISFNKNKILGLADNQTDLKSTINWDTAWKNTPYTVAAIGQPIGEMYGLVFDGTYKASMFDLDASGNPTILKAGVPDNGNVRANIRPGQVKYKDLNGDGKITTADNTIIGHGLPKHIGGFTNNFTYKNFDLNVFFQWSYGNDIMNANRIFFERGSGINLNQFATYANRWTTGNPTSDMPGVGGYSGTAAAYSTNEVEDGSYIRLKTVSFGYNLDQELVHKFKLQSMRFYAAGQNLLTWTKYTGPDPEVSTYSSALVSGFDYSAYPRARVITVGVKATF